MSSSINKFEDLGQERLQCEKRGHAQKVLDRKESGSENIGYETGIDENLNPKMVTVFFGEALQH